MNLIYSIPVLVPLFVAAVLLVFFSEEKADHA